VDADLHSSWRECVYRERCEPGHASILAAGTHNIVIQAWGNCGHVYQAPETITVHWISHWFVEMDAVIT